MASPSIRRTQIDFTWQLGAAMTREVRWMVASFFPPTAVVPGGMCSLRTNTFTT